MVNRNLYEKIMNRVSKTIIRTLNERDFDEEGRWEFDEEIDNGGEYPHGEPWQGIFDLMTNEVFAIDDTPDIDPTNDRWNGKHKYICIEVEPDDYESYTIPATWNSPAEGETNIYSYTVRCDDFTYTTNEYQGTYYYEADESTKEPFEGLTEEQEKLITDWVDTNVDIEYWDFR